MQYTIEKFISEEDIRQCAYIMSVSEPWITLKRTMESAFNAINNKYNEIYGTKKDGQVIGFIVIRSEGVFTPYIQSTLDEN